jgi:hypothetical protein
VSCSFLVTQIPDCLYIVGETLVCHGEGHNVARETVIIRYSNFSLNIYRSSPRSQSFWPSGQNFRLHRYRTSKGTTHFCLHKISDIRSHIACFRPHVYRTLRSELINFRPPQYRTFIGISQGPVQPHFSTGPASYQSGNMGTTTRRWVRYEAT